MGARGSSRPRVGQARVYKVDLDGKEITLPVLVAGSTFSEAIPTGQRPSDVCAPAAMPAGGRL
jgi:hypothetical protein